MNNQNEQQNDESGLKPRRRGVYLLPNLLTTGAMFAGFYAIVAAMNGKFEPAAISVFNAMVLDGLDGRVARMTNTQIDIGAEYDSLSDMVSFGVAPALVMYIWSLSSMVEYGWQWGKLGWLGAFIYVAAAALRLARFNTKVSSADKRYFQGLPSPAAAAVVVGMVWFFFDQQVKGADVAPVALVLTVITGLLMVSNVSYYSFKDLDFKNKVPFIAIFAIVLIFVLIATDPPKTLFAGFLIYALSGPIISIMRRIRKRSQRQS
jgi:CDP-diacylglycerol--serine O-phosphatidyltransferase